MNLKKDKQKLIQLNREQVLIGDDTNSKQIKNQNQLLSFKKRLLGFGVGGLHIIFINLMRSLGSFDRSIDSE